MFNTPFLMIDSFSFHLISEKMKYLDKVTIQAEDMQRIDSMSQVLQKDGSRAMITIEGPIAYEASMIDKLLFGATSTKDIMNAVQEVAKDSKVKSVVFNVNSGGGEAHKMHILADMIYELSKVKACATINTGMMASAAYYAGSQTGRIYADDKMNQTGSIGTALMLHDTKGMADQAGVKVIPITTGPLKALPAQGVEISEDLIEYAQSRVNELQEGFSQAVMRVRPDADMEDGSEARTGKTFSVNHAGELGLIDGVKSIEEVFNMLEAGNKFRLLRKS